MRKKAINFGNTSHLDYIVSFLNQEPLPLGKTILRDWFSKAVNALRDELRELLTALVAPEALDVKYPVGAKNNRINRKWFRTFANKYLTPKNMLSRLVTRLNAQGLKPVWRLQMKAHTPTIEIRGIHAAVFMNGFGDSSNNRVWAAVAKLLESGEIRMLGVCAICRRFYVKSRDWQKCCAKSECKRKYDNILSAERKARARAKHQRDRKKTAMTPKTRRLRANGETLEPHG